MRLKKREIWKTIPNFSDYAISDKGRVKRLTQACGTQAGLILKSVFDKDGYLFVTLRGNDGKTKQKYNHKLVIETFVGPCPEGYHSHHKDKIKTRNTLSNLEYILKEKHNSIHHSGKIPWNKGLTYSFIQSHIKED